MRKRNRISFSVSPSAAVFFPLLLCTDRGRLFFPALFPAVIFHEFGHLLALRAARISVRRIDVRITGLSIDTAPICSPASEMLCSLAGPAAGLLWAWAAKNLPAAWAIRSSALSLSLSAFNLLPVPVLDGGRALQALTGSHLWVRIAGGCASAFLLILAAGHREWLLMLVSLYLWLSCLQP